MSRREKMSPEQWQQYVAERNRQEGNVLCICGIVLMAYGLISAGLTNLTTVILFPWQGVCAITIAGCIYELFFCFRGFFEGENLKKYDMKISAIFIMAGLCLIMMIRQTDIDMPVLVMYPVICVIGYSFWESGKERLNKK